MASQSDVASGLENLPSTEPLLLPAPIMQQFLSDTLSVWSRITQGLYEQGRQRFHMLLTKSSKGIVVGMLVGRQIAKCNVIVSSLLDLAGTRDSDAVTVKQQPRHQQWMVR